MKLHQLPRISKIAKKRVGRGLGSGKGKTGGRGTKGQKARGKIALGFIGGTLPLYKKLPYRRGLGNAKQTPKPVVIPLSKLASLKIGSVVDLESLIEHKIVTAKEIRKSGVKIVDNGEAPKGIIMKLPTSASAAGKIEKAGGKIESA
ncbi:50S ribosomal protein L15 [Candidatus Daviesbacteria bacterium RIFCSPLOWO2_01_FULL_43_38]|uniref:Large ribosomal subunit protein uL15 n=2 Tax=Candidatus Daviesiibacteriota TaxID=1752718 RepID=A0A1F5K8B1_9BACT|nr:MAG: 50S ribosomal protein L15 [Candidatus Daviesbacteria bacterium GW2011_GWA2_42_7]OGE20404.1 MAG: 50S ribosomal protein L15 [Candidatus Daviesbacteria bacterium RIFCSPHIGHO2_01_FULL_43_17]OGE37010.1 MAG: 50S ribosomal protein L15 [Candidatus Daviesbacteria bacterium RIFCSPHIGHO2_12_FULL_43_11]OGE63922.1 MAG: 50S ribosomal protein L15 [Candidatus Daviesbacteria bacterium RIFCSPLOWO2_01_FULL_43_38]OGE70721.1 MAG: 50S ribosomal protein L15 [Candidatus Daviesbacteria bacterium RIFCSPLOWO2_02_